MNDLDELRKKKMELYKQNYAAALQTSAEEEQQLQQQVYQLESALKQMMTPEALQRYGNVKLAHPETAIQALVILAQMAQTGNTGGMITDTGLKDVLTRLSQHKKQTKVNLHGAL